MLINVGRGTAINEPDLADALNSEEISAAALDTTKNEPLENSSSLWTAKNCFISAHDSAHSLKSLIRAFELFFQNIKNIQNGSTNKKPLLRVKGIFWMKYDASSKPSATIEWE